MSTREDIANLGVGDLEDAMARNAKFLERDSKYKKVGDNIAADRKQKLVELQGDSPRERYQAQVGVEDGEKIMYIVDTFSEGYRKVQDLANSTGEEIPVELDKEATWVRRLDQAQLFVALTEGLVNDHIPYQNVLKWIRQSYPESDEEIDDIIEAAEKSKYLEEKKMEIENQNRVTPQQSTEEVAPTGQNRIDAILSISNKMFDSKINFRDENQSELIDFANRTVEAIKSVGRD